MVDAYEVMKGMSIRDARSVASAWWACPCWSTSRSTCKTVLVRSTAIG